MGNDAMGTISKKIADEVIAGKYADDQPRKIVKYTDAWGAEAYGLICAHESLNRYDASPYVINPTVYWTAGTEVAA
jgi:hypothetical protein